MKITTLIEYVIEPRYKKYWFLKNRTVYDLFRRESISTPDEMGDFFDFLSKRRIETFNSFEAAEKIKKQLEQI